MLIDNDKSVVNTDNPCKNKFFFVYLQLNFYQLAKYNRNNRNINMKQSFLLSLIASLMLSFAQPVAAQHHRSQHYRTQMAAQQSATDDYDAIDAFSDTTSIDTTAHDHTSANDDEWVQTLGDAVQNCVDEFNEDSSWFGFFKFALKALLLLMALLFIAAAIFTIPFILVVGLIAAVLYYKRKNIMHGIQNMENDFNNISSSHSQSAFSPSDNAGADSEQHINKAKYEYYWERGVKKLALGFGLLLAGWIWAINLIMGIGALLICYGLCQIYMSSKYK